MAILMEEVIHMGTAMEAKITTMGIPMEDILTIRVMDIRTMGIRMKVQIRKSWKG